MRGKPCSLCILLLLCAAFSGCKTPLTKAIYARRSADVRILLENGASPNKKDGFGFTPLYAAAYRVQDPAIARLLLERGADFEDALWRCQKIKRHDRMGAACERLLLSLRPGQSAAGAPEPVAEKARTPDSDIDHPAMQLPERPQDYAVVIGIENYSDLPPARFAEHDSQVVMEHLLALGIPSRNVVQLQNGKAAYKSIEKYLEAWLPNNVTDSSRVFFYFSGHGAPDPKTGEAYLIPWDGDPGYLANTGYPVKRLYEKLSALKAKEVLVAMDACFSGAGGRSVLAKGARPLVMKLDAAAVPQNLTVFAAASGEQITSTLEDQGHGTFTYYFLKGLSGGAKDASGSITAKSLYDYLRPKVQDAARRQNLDQDPVLHGQSDRELVRFR